MNKKLAASVAILLSLATSAFAHRLDEYLQATILSVEKDRVEAFMRLIPGVAVSPAVLSNIDSNRDGALSEDERRAYAERVLRDVSFTIDGYPVTLRLVSFDFPRTEAIKEGLGEIQIQFRADLPVGDSHRKLIFENHHQSPISAYLMNCLVPSDRKIRIIVQKRNPNQSWYQLDYVQAENRPVPLPFRKWWSGAWAPLGVNVGFASIFRLGVRHIAEGTDHLLFLLVLLLPAPLLVLGSRWAGYAGVRQSLLQILRVVTAFTVGHSITLALAALELVRVPSRPIEVLIALSILVSAAHAFRPLFPGREAIIAAFFGLIHGLAFATTLGELGLGRWERVASILAFNMGIETMQLVVVTATMPSLLLLSRTHAYSVVRVGGALFAGFAAAGWMAERLLGIQNSVDVIVEGVAHRAVWIAGGLFLISSVCWSLRNALDGQSTAAKTRPQATFEQI